MLDFAKDKNMYKHFIHFIDEYDIVPNLTSFIPDFIGSYLPLGNYYIIRYNNENYISLEKQKDGYKIVNKTSKLDIKYHYIENYDRYIKEYFNSV